MRRFNPFPHLLAALLLACLSLNCTDPSTGPVVPPEGATGNGYYTITAPGGWMYQRSDSPMVITWLAAGVTPDIVTIGLYLGDSLVRTITSSVSAAAGTYTWYMAGSAIPSGDRYHIRIASVTDPLKYDFGSYFYIRSRYFGSIAVIEPVTGASVNRDSICTIRWEAEDSVGAFVRIELYNDSTYVYTLNAMVSATAVSYSVSALQSTLASGSRYRIRVSSYYDPGIYGFSGYFSVRSGYSGSIAVTLPTDTSNIRVGTYPLISWTTTGNIGAYVRIQLYSESTLMTTITSSTSAANGSYSSWYVSTSYTPGSRYRIRVLSYYDSSISAYSGYFTLKSQYYGTFAVTNPITTSVLAAGGTYQVQWIFAGMPGSYVKLQLYKDSAFVSTVASSVTNATSPGSYSWLVSTGLVSSDRYQLRVVSTADTTLFAWSSRFTISGVVTDTFEIDDSVRLAKPIATDSTVQRHNLTMNDQDWMTFNAAALKLYLISAVCSTSVITGLYADASPTAAIALDTGMVGANARILWLCTSAGKYNLLARPLSSSFTGTYQMAVKAYDSTAYAFTVTQPVADTAIQHGQICRVAWSSQISLGGLVDIFLYNAASAIPVQTIATGVANSGSYAGVIAADVPAGTGYYVKVVSQVHPAVSGRSGAFVITQ